MSVVLDVRDLNIRFTTDAGEVHAVNGLSYQLQSGEALAIVGESGSGKTVGALALMGLVPGNGRIDRGEITLAGAPLRTMSAQEWRAIRGRRIAMVFQDPMTSLNPVLSIGRQMTEGLRHHLGLPRAAAQERAVELLDRVGIPDARARLADHPHEFSGGQRQRVMIAMALACEPAVLIADEPTTALDVTVQAQIVELVNQLRTEAGLSVLWITHDLALVAGFADRVAVMYAGRIVELARVGDLFRTPSHPYTVALLDSMPSGRPGEPLRPVAGSPPDLRTLPRGCPFAPRCPWVLDACLNAPPALESVDGGHVSACIRAGERPWESPS